MKKNHSLLKVILITFLIFVLLSWIIKSGLFYNGNFYDAGTRTPLGIGDLFSIPFQSFYLYAEYGAIFLLIGGMYGVINKTGAYHNIIKFLARLFKKRRGLAIILVSLFIMLFESIFGVTILTFTLIPFFTSFLAELGFSKKISMFATIGSLILGSFASITGLGGLINYALDLERKNLFKIRIIIFFITFIIMTVFLIIKSRKDDSEKMEIVYEESRKKGIGLIIIMVLFTLVALIGMYNFADYLGIKIFANLSEKIANIKILNGIPTLGSWVVKDFAGLILFTILVITIFYRIKFNDLVESFISGSKKMLKVSFYATLSGLIFMYYYNSTTGYTFIETIVNYIYSSSGKYLAIKTMLATPIYMFLLNNSMFLANNVASILANLETSKTILMSSGLTLQLIMGLWSLIIPVNYILIAGLAYYDISYGKWFKYIWSILIILIILSGIIIFV